MCMFNLFVCLVVFSIHLSNYQAVFRGGELGFFKVQLNFHTFDLGEFCEGYVIGGSLYFTEIFVEMMMFFSNKLLASECRSRCITHFLTQEETTLPLKKRFVTEKRG